jgi:hypothetical protein
MLLAVYLFLLCKFNLTFFEKECGTATEFVVRKTRCYPMVFLITFIAFHKNISWKNVVSLTLFRRSSITPLPSMCLEQQTACGAY